MRVLSPALLSINLTPAPARRRSRALILPNLLVFQACAATVISAVTTWEQRRRPALLVAISNMFLPYQIRMAASPWSLLSRRGPLRRFLRLISQALVTTIGRVRPEPLSKGRAMPWVRTRPFVLIPHADPAESGGPSSIASLPRAQLVAPQSRRAWPRAIVSHNSSGTPLVRCRHTQFEGKPGRYAY
jgi:hypothetical protein